MARLLLSPPHMGDSERRLLMDAFDSNWIAPAGPDLDAFEQELATCTGSSHAVAVSSGTAAIHLALLQLGVGPGDTVLASTLTFVASVNPVIYAGADLCFIDSEPTTWNLDPQLLADELAGRARRGDLPKAVIAVDLYGQPADYHEIEPICAQYEVPLIDDAAEALGSTYRGRSAGTFGALGILSFNGNKIITTGGGGALLTENAEWAQRARFLATQARAHAAHYEHREIGYNYRLSNLAAAVGRGQLQVLDDRVRRRRTINQRYAEVLGGLPGVQLAPQPGGAVSNCWLTCITIDPLVAGADCNAVRMLLEEHDIESRPLWKPMHRQPVHAGRPARVNGVSDRLFETGLCLPSGSSMTEGDQDRVMAIVASCFERSTAAQVGRS